MKKRTKVMLRSNMKLKQNMGYVWLLLAFIIFLCVTLVLKVSTETLFRTQPLFITINLFLIIIFVLLAIKPLAGFLGSIPTKFWVIVLAIFILGLSVRLFVPPRLHKIYYDEDIYINIAHNIANEGRACLCDYGTPQKCIECIDNKQPMGMPTFYGILFRLFGGAGFNTEDSVFVTHIIISSLAIVLIFLLSYTLTGRGEIAVLGSLLLATNPTHIRWSVSTAQDTFFVTFMLLSALLFLLIPKYKSKPLVILGFLTLAYTLQIRTEGFLVVPIIALLFAAIEKRPWVYLKNRVVVCATILMLLLITPTIIHIYMNKEDPWGAPQGRKFSLEYFPKNSLDNIKFFFDSTRFPVLVTIFAFFGAYHLLAKKPIVLLALLTWFAMFFLLYGFFYAGSFNYGMDVRFMLTMIAPVLILSGTGIYYAWILFWESEANKAIIAKATKPLAAIIRLTKLGNKKLVKQRVIAVTKLVVFILLMVGLATFILIRYYPLISQFGPKASDAMSVHEFAKGFIPQTQRDCIFISQISSMFLNFDRPSIQTHRFLWGGVEDEVLSNYDCIYMYWGYWCANSQPHTREQCIPLLNKFNWVKVASYHFYEKEFAFYKMVKRK